MKVVGFLCYANQLGGSFIFLIFLVFGGGGRLVWVKKNLWEQWEGHLKMVKVKGDTALWMVESSLEPSKKGSPKIKFHDIYNSWAWIDANMWWYLMFAWCPGILFSQWQFLIFEDLWGTRSISLSLSVGKTHAHLLAAKVIGCSTYPLPNGKTNGSYLRPDHGLTSLLGGMFGYVCKLQEIPTTSSFSPNTKKGKQLAKQQQQLRLSWLRYPAVVPIPCQKEKKAKRISFVDFESAWNKSLWLLTSVQWWSWQFFVCTKKALWFVMQWCLPMRHFFFQTAIQLICCLFPLALVKPGECSSQSRRRSLRRSLPFLLAS